VEALSNSISTALRLQLALVATPVLNALLKDGLVVSGEVIESSAGIAYLSLGGKRVPAETAIDFRPGQKFAARVEKNGDSFVLRLLDASPDEAGGLVAALRTVLAEDRPAGALVSRLVAELVEHAETLDPHEKERVKALAREVERHVLVPKTDHPSHGSPSSSTALKDALTKGGVFHEALLAKGGELEIALARADLKSVLMRALRAVSKGPEHESLQRALAGIEAEQLLDVARTSAGDPRQIGIAVPDGAHLATASFVVHPDQGRERDSSEKQAKNRAAVDLSVSFSNLGPVRAEFRFEDGRMGVRFVVASEAVAARLTRDADALALGISAGGSLPSLQFVTAPRGSFATDVALEQVSFLRDHALMDRLG